MKIHIVKNKYLNALILVIIVSAVSHMIIVVIRAFMEKSFYPLNYFHILNLDYFFPNVFLNNFSGNLASIIFSAILYFFVLQKTGDKK